MKRLCLLLFLLVSFPSYAANPPVVDPVVPAPKYLVGANNTGWKTDVLFVNRNPPNSSDTNTDVFNGFAVRPQQVFVSTFTSPGFTLTKISPVYTQVDSLLTFSLGTSFGYLDVPALNVSHTKNDDSIEVWGVINDGQTTTDLAIFNIDPTKPSVARIGVFDNTGYITTEFIDLPPGLTFYRLKTSLHAGHLTITEGSGIGPGTLDVQLTGFAAVGKTGAPRVIPFAP